MRQMNSPWIRSSFVHVFLLFLVALQGCAINLIADYDQQTDKAVTALHRKFEAFFIEMEREVGTEAASYENHKDFYDEVKIDISTIKLRASVVPKNDLTLDQIKLLEENVALLEEVHREGISDVGVLTVAREDFNTALANILRLELAKKRDQ